MKPKNESKAADMMERKSPIEGITLRRGGYVSLGSIVAKNEPGKGEREGGKFEEYKVGDGLE
jgi:hypothetical protein